MGSIWETEEFGHPRGLANIALHALFLGILLGSHLSILVYGILYNSNVIPWSIFVVALAIYHSLEFFMTAMNSPSTLSVRSFLINHSFEYKLAMGLAVLEYWIEVWFVPSLKDNYRFVGVIGFFILALGQSIRTLAMYTAGSNFTHLISVSKVERHVLVTNGVYSYLRHPSYFGWFLWSVGSQILLMNPICTVLYTLASWKFFSDRVPYEERTLIMFFGEQYWNYARRSSIGIPFIESPALQMTKAEAMQSHAEYLRVESQ